MIYSILGGACEIGKGEIPPFLFILSGVGFRGEVLRVNLPSLTVPKCRFATLLKSPVTGAAWSLRGRRGGFCFLAGITVAEVYAV